jgi:hypothetical protein
MKTRALVIAGLLFCLAVPSLSRAQETTGALEGRVTDSSGGVLPGVSVILAGPSLIEGSRTTVTLDNGTYRLPNLPVGTYTLRFELQGFGRKTYETVRVQAGLTFKLNAELAVAGIEESVTVVGESPILETAAAETSFTFTKELMSTVPNARDVWAIVAQTPGVSTNTVNVGGTQTGNQLSFRGHGVDPRQNTYVLDGANITDSQNNGSSQFYLDVDSFEEMQLAVSSHSAEVQTPGMLVNIVPKTGTNAFRGGASFYYTNESLQGDNVDDALRARGVNRASNLNKYIDGGADFGGPIKRDRLWFYGAYRRQEVENFITGTRNPDGSFPIDRTVLWYPAFKLNTQVRRGHQSSFFFQTQEKKRFNRGLSATRPIETTQNQRARPLSRLFSIRHDWVASDKLLLNFRVNVVDGGFELAAQDSVDIQNTPARLDLATNVWADAPPSTFGVEEERRGFGFTGSYFLQSGAGGQHEFRFGFDAKVENYFGNQGGGALTAYPADHRLLFFNGQPLEVILFQSGAQSVVNPSRHAFIEDSWQVGRVRLNLGGRWDWQANRLAESTAPQSRFFATSVTQLETDNLITWNTFAPRLSAVIDVTGDAKTLVKAAYNRYYWQLWIDKGRDASTAGDRQFRYQWIDRNGDRRFTTDEQGQLLSLTDPALRPVTIDPDLSPTLTDEFNVGASRELRNNLSVSGTFRYRKDKNLSWRINQGVSAADYTPVVGTDPGPDGLLRTADDGGPITFYNLAAAKRGLSPNFITTRPGFDQEYTGFELTLYRRFADKWQFVGSYTTGLQRDNYAEGALGLPDASATSGLPSPQDVDQRDGTRIVQSKPHIVKLMGSYLLPRNVTLSAFYQYLSGDNYTREINSASAGVGTLNQGNIVALAGRRNQESFDGISLLDFRVQHDLKLGEKRLLAFVLDVFNAFNVNPAISQVNTSGSRFGQVLDLVPPRIVRFGVKLNF